MPRARSASPTWGWSSSGRATARGGRAFCAAVVTRRSSSLPAWRRPSQGSMSRTTAIAVILGRCRRRTARHLAPSGGGAELLHRPAEPDQGQRAAREQEHERAGGEAGRDLVLDLARGEAGGPGRGGRLERGGGGGRAAPPPRAV